MAFASTAILLLSTYFIGSCATSYQIRPVLEGSDPYIEVTLITQADLEGNATLVYFDKAWGEENLFDCISSIEVLNTGARIRKVPEQNRIYIKSKPSESLVVKYSIRQDFIGLAEKAHYYRPLVNQNYFHLFGHRLFMISEQLYESEEKQDVTISWAKTPYLVQHNFGIEESATYRIGRDELLESIVVGGDFRRESVHINGITVHLLTRGKWKNFSDKKLAQKLESIIEVQREFWNDYSDDIYTVTLLPLYHQGAGYLGGAGLSKGFASYCSNADLSRLEDLTGLYYHEIMHHWIGGKIRNASRSEELWFSEGFTEYFSHLLMQQEGEISKAKLGRIKSKINRLHTASKYAQIPNSELSLFSTADEEEDGDLESTPYRRGFLYALYLDRLMSEQQNSKGSLSDFMLSLLEESSTQNMSNSYFRSKICDWLGAQEGEAFDSYILNGDLIEKDLLF